VKFFVDDRDGWDKSLRLVLRFIELGIGVSGLGNILGLGVELCRFVDNLRAYR
jgi:hypothetical protein